MTPYAPSRYTPEDAAHLLRRAAFGGTEDQIQALAALGPQKATEQLLSFNQQEVAGNPFTPKDAVDIGSMIQVTKGRWIYEMIHGASPARERLALFWHNHFVIGTDKVRNTDSLSQYLAILRADSLGHFTDFAMDIAKSPAMLRYLDNDQNKKGKPNENFARELMELFTVGFGNYTEQDVKEGARGLTGWTFTGGRARADFQETPQFVFQARAHDDGVKNYRGHSGNFKPEDIVRLTTEDPQTPAYIAAKLWRGFVNDTPDKAGVQALAQVFQSSGGDLGQVMRALLTSQAFYAPENRYAIVKGPTDYVVGALRAMGSPRLDDQRYLNLSASLGRMGQELLRPPTVKGWDGGREWINDSTLLLRMQTAAAMTLGYAKGKQSAQTGRPALESASTLAFLGDSRSRISAAIQKLKPTQQAYMMLISPEYALA